MFAWTRRRPGDCRGLQSHLRCVSNVTKFVCLKSPCNFRHPDSNALTAGQQQNDNDVPLTAANPTRGEAEMTNLGFSHIGLSTLDLEKTRQFYEGILGFKAVLADTIRITEGG